MESAHGHASAHSEQGAASMPQMPSMPAGLDLSFLANYPPEQIAAIGQLFLSGQMQLPGAVVPTATPPVAAPVPPVSVPAAVVATSAGPDLEDGEISEASDEGYVPPVHVKRRRASSPIQTAQKKRHLSPAFYAKQQSQLESFIRVLYDHGYGFDAVKQHVHASREDELTSFYRHLSLSTKIAKQVHPPKPKAESTAKPVVAATPAVQSTPAPDRQAYLAKLQAAKAKKPDPAASTAVKSTAPTVPVTAPPAKKGLDPEKSELLRQRLAALKAAQASKQAAAAAVSQQTSPALDVDNFLNSMQLPATSSLMQQQAQPFDSEAASDQNLVISVSENEQSESELDDTSLYSDGGVRVMPAPLANGSAHSSHQSASSSNRSPNGRMLEQKMQDIAALRKRLAELEQRKQSKPHIESTTAAIAQTASSLQAAQQDLAVHAEGISNGVPGLYTATDARQPNLHEDDSMVVDQQESNDEASESSDFEELYGDQIEPAVQPFQTQQPTIPEPEDESEWTGTASESEGEADNSVPPVITASQVPADVVMDDEDSDSDSDSCSMEMSEADSDESSEAINDTNQAGYEPVPRALVVPPAVADSASLQQTGSNVDQSGYSSDNQKPSYLPYHSALTMLKRYRFHPHLASSVESAWRSPTWTHKDGWDIMVPAESKSLCRYHDDLPNHIHWEDYVLYGGEYLADLAWNPGWDELERQEWDAAMQAAAQEQSQHQMNAGPELTSLCESIIAKHAKAWSERVRDRTCQTMS